MSDCNNKSWVPDGFAPHSSHWGVFSARQDGDELDVRPFPGDPDPNRILYNFRNTLRHKARVARPAFRKGWLKNGPGPSTERGRDEFVELPWDEALDILAAELARVRDEHGNEAIYGGSYGWSSAGRFHHAQSQVHRFLNTALGGYVRSVNTYSAGASAVLIPHVLGNYEEVTKNNVSWQQLAESSEVVLAFGGMALRNSRVAGGGTSEHIERDCMQRAAQRGCEFVLLSPIRDDLPEALDAEWLGLMPGSDTAFMLALVQTLVDAGLHNLAFLESHCVGWSEFSRYLSGETDGIKKAAEWAAPITGISADAIRALALRLPGKRVLVTVSHSLQRARYGEQPVWMGAVLASVLGQIGLPGGGYGYGLGALAYYGRPYNAVDLPTLSQGRNQVRAFIPVARVSDMLLKPGQPYRYNGQTLNYPEIKLAYWAGGNPYHHHQDLNTLSSAFAQLDTLVVHEISWTSTAKHADIVLPCTMTLEREDIGGNSNDALMLPMQRIAAPYEMARDDYDIFTGLAERLGQRESFTEGRDARQWLEHLYEGTRAALEKTGHPAPDFETFWQGDGFALPQKPETGGMLSAFRKDPEHAPLATPSGRIEICSETIASFGAADCPGHPSWLGQPETPTAEAPLILIANQPATRLHSQLDYGQYSQQAKSNGREVVRLTSCDAETRGISTGDTVRLFNARGSCLATARLDDSLREGVIQLPTGAWYDPVPTACGPMECIQGNPNVLTLDVGTSELAQGCSGQLTTVQLERFSGEPPQSRPHEEPKFA